MGTIKKQEEIVYVAVINGELLIEDDGSIWRVAIRTGDRWNPGTYRLCSVPKRRAEHLLPTGYLQVRLMVEGVRANALAHRLVYRHWNGPLPEGMEVNHKNGQKADNHPCNLELATTSQNQIHALRVLQVGRTDQRGEKNAMATLTDVQVAEIRRRRSAGELLTSIAKDYGVAFQTISRIALHQRR